MIKKIISIFFILVFLIPLLPVKEVGQLIAGATMTEEIPDTGSAKSTNGKVDTKWLINADGCNFDLLSRGSQSLYIHFSETLPFLFASDVQTPPPNSFC
jgi:hypothetical protein